MQREAKARLAAAFQPPSTSSMHGRRAAALIALLFAGASACPLAAACLSIKQRQGRQVDAGGAPLPAAIPPAEAATDGHPPLPLPRRLLQHGGPSSRAEQFSARVRQFIVSRTEYGVPSMAGDVGSS